VLILLKFPNENFNIIAFQYDKNEAEIVNGKRNRFKQTKNIFLPNDVLLVEKLLFTY
jgi:hypothetical protein